MTQGEVEASSIRGSPETVVVSPGVVGSCRWEGPPTPSPRRDEDSTVHGSDPSHSPQVVRLNQKSADEDEEFYLRRQSSTSSATSDKTRSNYNGALPSPGKRSALEQPNHDSSTVGTVQGMPPALIMDDSSRKRSGLLLHVDQLSDFDRPSRPLDAEGCSERLSSGYLYPCANLRESPNSCMLNSAHFTFDTSTLASPDLGVSTGGNNNNTNLTVERIFKKLMGHRSVSSKSGSVGWDASSSKSSPVSTLDCPKSPTTSERSFLAKSKRKSLRSRVEDANTVIAANPRPKSNLAQYLRSITASNSGDLAIEDDDTLEGPSESAWLEPDSPYSVDGSHASTRGRNPSKSASRSALESSTWNPTWNLPNLSLVVQNPLRTVSTIVSRKHHGHQATPRRSLPKASRLGESRQDTITRISLTGSYDGSYSARCRGAVRKGTASEVSSGRSWWSEIGSGRKSTSIWTCSGRLQMEVAAEPDATLEPDTAKSANNAVDKKEAQTEKVNEAAFPFNNPIASSFVFREGPARADCATPDCSASPSIDVQKSGPVVDVSVTESDSNDSELHLDDICHNPEDHGSINLTDSSEASPHWDSISGYHSFDYVREVAVGSSGLSSRALGRLLLIERSGLEIRDGRFSVDLQRGQKLDKAPQLPRTPDEAVQILAAEKSPKHRSILSPCLLFLQRSPFNKPGIIIQQGPDAPPVAPPSRRLHAMDSFTARLGPVAETPALASPIYAQ